jgi:hypothetical protein
LSLEKFLPRVGLLIYALRHEQQIAVDRAVTLRWYARKPTELRRFAAKVADFDHGYALAQLLLTTMSASIQHNQPGILTLS